MTKIINSLSKLDIKKSVITIGKFDGVHLGHKKIIDYTVSEAKKHSAKSVVITFKTDRKTVYSFDHNIELIKKLSPNYIVVIDFSAEFYKMAYNEFFNKLIECYNAFEIVVGNDFCFGHNRLGNAKKLEKLSKNAGVKATIFPFLLRKKEKISSKTIKIYIADGRIDEASKLLGRTYSVSSTVEKGKALGRTIGYPTANLCIKSSTVMPKEGVYFSLCKIAKSGKFLESMTFAGKTNLNTGLRFETNIFDYSGNLYGKAVEVFLLKYERENVPIHSVEELKNLLNQDEQNARKYFKRRKL